MAYNAKLSDAVIETIRRDRAAGASLREIARRVGCSKDAARKYGQSVTGSVTGSGRLTEAAPLPDPAPEAGGPSLPDPLPLTYDPFVIDIPGWYGVISDVHLPYHDKRTIEAWVDDCKRRNVSVVILNGDILDCAEVSAHYREPSIPRLKEEVDIGKQFFAYLRSKFPRAQIIYKEGNHDFRVRSYVANRAPALWDIPGCTLPAMLGLTDYGIDYVAEKRVIKVHKLNIVHGHEFRGGGGVNPARWLYLRTNATALCGHFHRSSYHPERSLDNKLFACWSVGCACFLYPQYDPNNKWNHGYAMIERFARTDGFHVDNRMLLPDGRIV